MSKNRINIGLVGVGRLGRMYAGFLATQVRHCRLIAVSDLDGKLAEEVADEFDVPHWYADAIDLLDSEDVTAAVIVTPTHTHCTLVKECLARGKPAFCEKPLSLSLEESLEVKQAIKSSGGFFQMGFMRRFDRGLLAAKQKMEEGVIGKPVVFKSTSRDPYPPSLEYLAPSGGMLIDMGIHDFDVAHWLFGKVEQVSAVGAVLAFPDFKTVGDIDNAFATLTFQNGCLGMIDICRHGVYGYEVSTEILGTEGTLRAGYLRETPIMVLKENNISHDTVPFFRERFGPAYVRQLQDFVENLLNDRDPSVTVDDGIRALQLAIAATHSSQSGETVKVDYFD